MLDSIFLSYVLVRLYCSYEEWLRDQPEYHTSNTGRNCCEGMRISENMATFNPFTVVDRTFLPQKKCTVYCVLLKHAE
jgi:hypothetical protein